MACGPVTRQSDRLAEIPFSFSSDPLHQAGWGAFAMMMTLPWRAAAVVANEAMRDSMRHWR